MSDTNSQRQVDIFANDQRQRYFAELCNALYERELQALSQHAPNNLSLLQRRLAGLPYHIKNAAEHLLNHNAPIEVDVHNGSWQAKQAAKCVSSKHDQDKNHAWYHSHVRMGLPVPIYISELGVQTVELDSIDRIDAESHKLHVNKHGWFDYSGQALSQSKSLHYETRLLLPNKANMVAACCGHSWNHRGKSLPRALSLRELLLSTTINWKNFK
ncbi:hypothetical protein [Aliiglaciecola litoralis]